MRPDTFFPHLLLRPRAHSACLSSGPLPPPRPLPGTRCLQRAARLPRPLRALAHTPGSQTEPALTTLTGTMSALLPPARCTPGPCQSPHIISPARQGTCSLLSCLALPLEKKLKAMRNFVCLITDVTPCLGLGPAHRQPSTNICRMN